MEELLDRQTPKNKVYKDKALPSGQIAKSNYNYLIRIFQSAEHTFFYTNTSSFAARSFWFVVCNNKLMQNPLIKINKLNAKQIHILANSQHSN